MDEWRMDCQNPFCHSTLKERMDEYRMARRVLTAELSRGRLRGRPRLRWINGVKVALGNREMTVRVRVNARKIGKSSAL